VKIIATIEPASEDASGSGPSQVREISVETETHEADFTELREQLAAGWRIMNLRRDSY
jgi:hypothetical protein